jgi:non-ribosomal peptide synthetase-like protein
MSEIEREIGPYPFAFAAGTVVDEGSPTSRPEKALLEILTDVVRTGQMSVDSNFFDDLGADSMVMARFCARVRKRPDLPAVTIKDVYLHPTIRSLVEALVDTSPATHATPAPEEAPAPGAPARRAGTPMYVFCGVIQVLIIVAYLAAAEAVGYQGWLWVSAATSVGALLLRAAVYGDAVFLAMCILPIAAKWVLIGRWKTQEIPAWSLSYVRFWLVKTLIRTNPLLVLIGGRSRSNTTSPILNFYLRALGAKVGRGVAIYTRLLPVCTDLLTIGAGTVIRNDTLIACYRAHDGRIQTGPVRLGEDVFVGENSVIDIGTSMGDRAQLGHSSTLHMRQSVPHGESWHGSPAQRTDTNYRLVGQVAGARRTVVRFGVMQLLSAFVVSVPLTVAVLVLGLDNVPQLDRLLNPGAGALTTWSFYRDTLTISGVFVGASLVVGLLITGTVPRVLNLMIKPDTEYPLFGFHYEIHSTIARLTNSRFLTGFFGDTSYIVHYLRWIGYDLTTVAQTGSNFGTEVKHENPYLVTVGTGTMVADSLSIMNADFSNTSFRLSRAKIGAHNFLGNVINYPAQSRVGDNCLIATKAMVPIDDPIREGTGLLGAPNLSIPRIVARDKVFRLGRAELRRSLHAKNRHNIVTMVLYLLIRWAFLASTLTIIGALSELYEEEWYRPETIVVAGFAFPLFTISWLALTERLVTRFRRLQPRYCSIYDPLFWRHERYWKLNSPDYFQLFNGTPLKGLLWRMLGVRVGRRFFDDGLFLSERSLVTIGDDCTANQTSQIFAHSQEDGVFKSDYVTIGSRVTLGAGVFMNYGVTIGDDAVIEAHSFVMKGEEIPEGSHWSGNPAVEVDVTTTTSPAWSTGDCGASVG